MTNTNINTNAPDDSEIPVVLAFDVGNTAIKFACVKGDDVGATESCLIKDTAQLAGDIQRIAESAGDIRAFVACSVNAAGLEILEAAVGEIYDSNVMVVGCDIPLPMETDLVEPDTCGSDRLCAAVAAYYQLGTSCIVADLGSAITIDCVDDKGVFLGGAILPGLAMSADALHKKTCQLPRVDITLPENAIGKTTDQAIAIGIILGARGAIRTITETYATELNSWPHVIITGGDANLIYPNVQDSDLVQAVVPDLTLRGVAIAFYKSLIDECLIDE